MSQGCWGWFLRNVLRQDDERIPDNSRVIHARSEPQLKELIGTAKRSVVVAFSASWCGSSRYIRPVFHALSATYPSTIFVQVDVDELQSVARSHCVTTTPTFQFFRGGAKCDELRGADSGGLEKRIKRHYVAEEADDDNTASDGSDDCKALRQRKPKPHVATVATDEQWQRLVQQNQDSSKALVVEFWATWCKPCVEIAPFFDELSGRFPSAVFARVDVDELETVSEAFSVSSLPSFKVLKRGEVVDELGGAIRGALEAMVARHSGSAAASC